MSNNIAEVSQASVMEQPVPAGYKQTDAGIIPEDWNHLSFGDALTIRHGRNQKEVEATSGKYPIFGTGGQMGWANEYLCDQPSVLIGRKGSINKPRYIDQPFWTVDTLFYSEIKEDFNPKYIYYQFCTIDWMLHNEASGVPSLNASTIEKVFSLFPPYKEQTAIAKILSDVDVLLDSLEALIAKKQAIKTATMQQLLTGRTRLSQFAHHPDGSKKGYKQSELGEIPEDWGVVPLGSLLSDFRNGYSFSAQGYMKNGTPIITIGQISLSGRFQFDLSKVNRWRASDFNKLKDFWVRNGDLLIAMTDVTPDKNLIGQMTIAKLDSIALLNQRVGLLRVDENKGMSIFYSYLSGLPVWKTYCKGVASLGVQANISTSDIKRALVFKPTVEEQTAIATILSDMDAEIQALEQRLNKTRQLKQGMMQQLLTGKVRLVTPA